MIYLFVSVFMVTLKKGKNYFRALKTERTSNKYHYKKEHKNGPFESPQANSHFDQKNSIELSEPVVKHPVDHVPCLLSGCSLDKP